jgi:transcription antitermination factor NusA-like protein
MSLRHLLANLHAGTIIGKGGANVKAIRELSGCKVSIAEASMPGGDRLVTITGAPLSINRAVELILERIEESAGEAVAFATAAGGAGISHTLRLIVANNQVGAIIGKGGSSIKEFREGSGANIKVESDARAGGERLVTITGVKAAAVRAHELLALKLATVPEDTSSAGPPAKFQRTQQQQPPPPSQQQSHPSPYGYYAPPPAVQQQQQQSAYPRYASQPPSAGYGGGYAPPPGYGAPPHAPAAQSSYYAPPLHQQQQPQSSGYGSAGRYAAPGSGSGGYQPSQAAQAATYTQGGYSFVGAGPEYSAPYPAAEPQPSSQSWPPPTATGGPDNETVQLVPQQNAGRLIGKGGSGIRELRETSRAQIKILSECEPGTELRKMTISGTLEAVQAAISMIHARLAQGP